MCQPFVTQNQMISIFVNFRCTIAGQGFGFYYMKNWIYFSKGFSIWMKKIPFFGRLPNVVLCIRLSNLKDRDVQEKSPASTWLFIKEIEKEKEVLLVYWSPLHSLLDSFLGWVNSFTLIHFALFYLHYSLSKLKGSCYFPYPHLVSISSYWIQIKVHLRTKVATLLSRTILETQFYFRLFHLRNGEENAKF